MHIALQRGMRSLWVRGIILRRAISQRIRPHFQNALCLIIVKSSFRPRLYPILADTRCKFVRMFAVRRVVPNLAARVVARSSSTAAFPPLSALSDEEQSIKDAVAKFAKDVIAPRVREMDEKCQIDPQIFKGASASCARRLARAMQLAASAPRSASF